MKKGWTLDEIVADDTKHAELITLAQRRYRASANYVQPWHEKFVRYFKIYRSIIDATDDADEPNTVISYAYGIIEDLVSKITEPILQMRPPCRVQERRAGQARAAENFANICSTYFHSARYQLEFTESVREMTICGNSWENDGWSQEYIDGKRWAKVPKKGVLDKVKGFLGRVIPGMTAGFDYESIEEVPYRYPYRVGYNTRFPWIFDVYPEPGVKNVRDMHYLIEQERNVAVDDLKRRQYLDPATNDLKPFFNFTRFEREVGDHKPGRITPILPDQNSDYGAEALESLSGQDDKTAQESEPDMDKVYLQWVWEPDRMFCVMQGAYVVAYQEDLFHCPRIPYRLKVYTPSKEFLFGMGAIEPVENQLNELNDIHRMSMANWIRIVNQMIAYDPDMITDKNDWKPRAGGKVRVKTNGVRSIHDAFAAINQTDVTKSMLTQESNTKGLIERELSITDYSPGVEGTKPSHKTLGGLMEISRKVAQRTTTIRRMILSGYQDQMWFMEKLFSQYQFDKAPFSVYGPDGSTAPAEMNMWDINTDGEGFNFVIEYDPSFGDDALLRNQMLSLLDVCIKYNGAVKKLGTKDSELVELPDIMRRVFKAYGWNDTSQVLKKPDGTRTPEEELQLMLQGQPVAPQPNEDFVGHLIDHTIQLNSPALQKGVQLGQIDPKVIVLIKAHIDATSMRIAQVLQNPGQMAQAKMAVMQAQAGRLSPQGSALAAVAPDQGESPLRQPNPPRAGMPAGVGSNFGG